MIAKLPRSIFWVNVVVFSAALIQILRTGNFEFAFYVGSLVPVIAIVLAINHRIDLGPKILWGLSIWAAAHMAGGLLTLPIGWPYQGDQPVVYSGWIIPGYFKYDNLVHAFGFGVCTLICHRCLASVIQSPAAQHLGVIVIAALAGCGLGALNEIIEFIATVISPDTNVGGYVNTALDLVFNLIGSSIAVVVLWSRRPSELRMVEQNNL